MFRTANPARSFIYCAVILITLAPYAAFGTPQSPLLEVRVMDTTAESGATDVPISIYMNNYEDTVAGFSLWLLLSRPDILEFQLSFDTSGTLTSGWELILVNHIGGTPYNIKIVGVANWPPPPTTPGISPQQNGLPLIKLIADIDAVPDTTTNRSVDILIARSNLSEFAFSDPMGQVIGTVQDSVLDTAFYACLEWVGDSCLEWELVNPWEPHDSTYIFWHQISVLDTLRVFVNDGSLTVTGGYVCGNIDNDAGGAIDISDLIYLVDWMFSGGQEPPVLMAADCDGDGENDISDLVWLANYMFTGGSPPLCGQ